MEEFLKMIRASKKEANVEISEINVDSVRIDMKLVQQKDSLVQTSYVDVNVKLENDEVVVDVLGETEVVLTYDGVVVESLDKLNTRLKLHGFEEVKSFNSAVYEVELLKVAASLHPVVQLMVLCNKFN